MLIIDSTTALARALDQPIDPALKELLGTRRDQMAGAADIGDVARFHIVDGSDSLTSIEAAIGFPLLTADLEAAASNSSDATPNWDWSWHHDEGWTEVVFNLSEDGPADVLLVPDTDDIDPALSALLQEFAAPALERFGTAIA